MQKQQNLQDLVLNTARKERMTVTVFLMNGFQFKGTVRGFDSFVVIIETDGRQQMIYKHAISTVTPARPISGSFTGEKAEKGEQPKKAKEPKEA